ncbi:MAG: serine hydrolase [Leptolyngbya sp. SIOISBB]|nr:serine hydrolase [Leptolyngbya sp. SIOISBB]
MPELPTQFAVLRSRYTPRRRHWAVMAAMVGGGTLGWLVALLVGQLLGQAVSACQLPASAIESLRDCRPVVANPPIAPATGNYLRAAGSVMETRWRLPSEAEPLSVATGLPSTNPPGLAPLMYAFQPPSFNESARLQETVARLEAIAQSSEYPVDALSISLVDLTTGEYAGLRDRTPRYPASVIKPFWAIAALAYGETGPDIEAAMTYSSNEASNRLLNRVGHPVMRAYWQAAGFSISAQYPVNVRVAGRPGNIVTTIDLVRLLHDIESPSGHQRIAQAMWHDVNAERHNPVGAVKGFLGGGLPDGSLLTKVGLTSGVRAEMAILTLGDHVYAIAIIGAHPTYARSESIFPAFGDILFQLLAQ